MVTQRQFALLVVLALLTFGWVPVSSAKTVINIGAYYFPPIAEIDDDLQPSCFLGDLIQRLGTTYPDFDFHVVYTSPKRRYLDFEAGLYDVIFFESADWDWSNRSVTISPPLLAEEQRYVALKKSGRDQSFFKDITKHHIAALAGYHYRLLGDEANTQILRNEFNLELSDSHTRSIQLIMADRESVADIAVTNRAYLRNHFSKYPEDRNKLLVSEKPNHSFELRIIARKNGALSARDLYNMLTPMFDDGTYQSLVKKWGLELPTNFPGSLSVDPKATL